MGIILDILKEHSNFEHKFQEKLKREYIEIEKTKVIKHNLILVYEKHLAIDKNQFVDDCGNMYDFSDVFICNIKKKPIYFKISVSDKKSYSEDFVSDVKKVILSYNIEISKGIFDTTKTFIFFNVKNCEGLYLAKLPIKTKNIEYFNVYCFYGVEFRCKYLRNKLGESLINLVTSKEYQIAKKEYDYSKLVGTFDNSLCY